jgi:Response regulator containing a CheY-like receiver domain and a GGDEF domain
MLRRVARAGRGRDHAHHRVALADSADPYRVLIVEDDRSQAIFAESILRKAGMTTRMCTDPLAALDQLDEFQPELILMDLYMPACDGMELTSIIREREAFVSTPIVFLSGEQNEEKHFEALDSGGDDFLNKPIRPKHLIAAVTNRVRRARQLERRGTGGSPRDPVPACTCAPMCSTRSTPCSRARMRLHRWAD